MLLIKIEGETERPLITNYLLFPTKTNFKITMYLLCTNVAELTEMCEK